MDQELAENLSSLMESDDLESMIYSLENQSLHEEPITPRRGAPIDRPLTPWKHLYCISYGSESEEEY